MYNSGKTLKGLLSSVIHQTYQNYEVILIDDGSSDDTKKICNQYKNIDKRFKYYYKENEGVSIARNMGIDLANGDYITFIDSDDLIDEKYLEVLLNLAKSNDVDIVICNVLKECDGEIIDSFTMQDCIINIKEAFELLFTRKKINSGPCAKLFKSRIIKNIKFPKMTAYEDIIFIKDVFEKAKSIYVTNKISYHYIEQKGVQCINF